MSSRTGQWKMALPQDQLNHFAVETLYNTIYTLAPILTQSQQHKMVPMKMIQQPKQA